jgi:hypothetical protein
MTTTHDDRPHPVPAVAFMRYKENYFFIIMDPAAGVHGVSHINNEPLFNRTRFSLNLSVRGQPYHYASETPLPNPFEAVSELSDGKFSIRFVEAHKRFEMTLTSDEFSAAIIFVARRPTFDFQFCAAAAPENPSFKEVMTLSTNLPYNHQQQSLTVSGSVTIRRGGKQETIRIDGLGYRDHSWSMRSDNISRRHFWTGHNLPGRAIGCKVLETIHRPGLWAKEGYVSDADGERALRTINVTSHGSRDGWPELVRFELRDVYGKPFTLEADIAGRHADVPLHSEKADKGMQTYEILETISPVKLLETGETGVSLVEIGRHPSVRDAY